MIMIPRRAALFTGAALLVAPVVAKAQSVLRLTLATAPAEGILWVRI